METNSIIARVTIETCNNMSWLTHSDLVNSKNLALN